ncbi:alpha/beta hydrolase [Maritimibacter dapengensis]|uniref:Alpha/beta hydrolase n=1 Tax=Maritimibacter dapengensis TaxID=2836868 RepID=A0ABS6T517_9RHOB|nr:alpha/beta hydrolase [Maritimibacter dapengensis]MBV7380285.1 alpha/beta hydrolase [Maritimibacter dapengensis]
MSKAKTIWALLKVIAPTAITRMLVGHRPVVDGRRIDAEAQAASALVSLLRDPDAMPSVEESRRQLSNMAAKFDQPCPDDVVTRDIEIAGAFGPRRARVYVPSDGDPDGALHTLFYLHGGGWVQGGIDTHDGLCGHIAKDAGIRVISYDYVLAPERRFPDAPDDVLAAYRSLLAADLGIEPAQLIVGGDSAGANLAAVLMHDLQEAGAPMPRGQLLIYPSVDGRLESRSMETLADQPLLPRKRIEWFLEHYLPEGQDRTVPRLSPLFSPLHVGQPPALIIVGGHDPLWDDGIAYAEALERAGVPVTLLRYEGQVHAFLSLTKVIREGREARDAAIAWLARSFST